MVAINYAAWPAPALVREAQSLAADLEARDERMISLAIALRDQLEPDEGDDADNPTAWRLAEVLVQVGDDAADVYRLKDCLEALRKAALASE